MKRTRLTFVVDHIPVISFNVTKQNRALLYQGGSGVASIRAKRQMPTQFCEAKFEICVDFKSITKLTLTLILLRFY